MEPIISVVYHQRTLQFEQSAYHAFQAYEKRLKVYFENIDSGLEAFDDLQYRMAEILEAQNRSKPISVLEIQQLIGQIGEPADFDVSAALNTDEVAEPKVKTADGVNDAGAKEVKKWSFFRSQNEKMLGGVCAGLAQTFAIDPIAVRLIFVLVTLLQVATLFTVNMGTLAYILLWVFVPAKQTALPTQRKYFRDPQFRIIGGVCSGLAKLFTVEPWMIRLLFLAPLLLELLWENGVSKGVWDADMSFNGISFIVYITLWIITPLARTGTDFMLLNGAPINLNTIQQVGAVEQQNVQKTGGLTTLLRVLAYGVMILVGLLLVPFVASMGLGMFVAYRASDFILFSTLNKSLAFLVIVLVFILPFLALLFGIVRRLAGYAKPHRALRKTMLVLHLLGWLAAGALVYSLVQQHHTISRKKGEFTFVPTKDTLRVQSLEKDTLQSDDLFSFSWNSPNSLIQSTGDLYKCRTIWVNFRKSNDSVVRVVVTRRATGSNEADAGKEIERFSIEPQYTNGVLYLPRHFMLNKQSAYHFQHAQVEVFVPSKMAVQADRSFRKHQNGSFNIGYSSSTFSHTLIDDEPDSIIRMSDLLENELADELDPAAATKMDSLRKMRKRLKQEKASLLDSIDRAIDAIREP
jgi:phage shock protein PspC (stress-responsive transcriptional regulator)